MWIVEKDLQFLPCLSRNHRHDILTWQTWQIFFFFYYHSGKRKKGGMFSNLDKCLCLSLFVCGNPIKEAKFEPKFKDIYKQWSVDQEQTQGKEGGKRNKSKKRWTDKHNWVQRLVYTTMLLGETTKIFYQKCLLFRQQQHFWGLKNAKKLKPPSKVEILEMLDHCISV